MTTIQFPSFPGEAITASLYEIAGPVIQADVSASEGAPSTFNATFTTVPDGLYRIVVSDSDGPLFNDTVEIEATKAINLVTSETPVSVLNDQLDQILQAANDAGSDVQDVSDMIFGTSATPDATNSPLLAQIERAGGVADETKSEVRKVPRAEQEIPAGEHRRRITGERGAGDINEAFEATP